MKRSLFSAVALSLFLINPLAFAEDKKWFIIKGKRGICRIISASDKTPKTIAGPYATKDEATAAKAELCEDTSAKSKKKSTQGPTSTVGKIMKKTAEKAVERTIYEVIKRFIDDMFKKQSD